MKTDRVFSEQIESIIRSLVPLRDPADLAAREYPAGLTLVTKEGLHLVIELKPAASTMIIRDALVQMMAYSNAAAGRTGTPVVPVIAVPSMGETGQRLCEEAKVGWVDLAGNANIQGPGLTVRVTGRPAVRQKAPGGENNPFAAKSSRVVKSLLSNPDHWFSQREMAAASNLDEGYVSKIVRRLESDSQIERSSERRFRARSPGTLLDEWREHYSFSRHATIVAGHVAARSGDELIELVGARLGAGNIKHGFTGLAGAWLLTKFASFRLGTVLVESQPDAASLDALGYRPDPKGANLWIVIPGDTQTIRSVQIVDGFACADPVQVYLDLKGHPERSKEAAEELRQRLLQWRDHG